MGGKAAGEELRELGLRPMTWAETLAAVQTRLAPAERERFTRLHRNFVGYLSPETSARFHGFVFAHQLHLEVNGYRFGRLEAVLDILLARVPDGRRILDVGAGAGLIATVLLKRCRPRAYVLQDPCPEARDYLMSLGLQVLPDPPTKAHPSGRFDLILCIDSLGEIHSDEDGALAHPGETLPEERARLIEERYGFAQKLEAWKPFLAEDGRVLLWEPIKHRAIWEGIALLLADAGWKTTLHTNSPRDSYLELTLG